jgi:hypothetical protein
MQKHGHSWWLDHLAALLTLDSPSGDGLIVLFPARAQERGYRNFGG